MVTRVGFLIDISIAPSTYKVYHRAWVLLAQAMLIMGQNFVGRDSLPLSSNQMLMFVGFLSAEGLSSSTITSYTAAIGYVHKFLNLYDPTKVTIVQKVLSTCNKIHKSVDSRLPITLVILQQLIQAVNHTISNF